MATALAEQRTDSPATTTSALADRLQDLSWPDLSLEAVTVAKQCLLDWVGVTLAAPPCWVAFCALQPAYPSRV